MLIEKQIKITIEEPEEIEVLSILCELARQRIEIAKRENNITTGDYEKWAPLVSLSTLQAKQLMEFCEKIWSLNN